MTKFDKLALQVRETILADDLAELRALKRRRFRGNVARWFRQMLRKLDG